MRKYAFVLFCLICFGLLHAEFTPFAIPYKVNPDSRINVQFYPVEGAGDRIAVRNGHFARGGERIRLWGVNLSFNANFPTHQDAAYVARRLASGGVNTVRCHHMDTSAWPRGLWDPKKGNEIYPEALDRLDYFINELAKNGIYVNLNLHVGHAHSKYIDGVPEANRGYDKISNIFTPVLIDAQKKFAREMLSHENPYRKMTYAEDPVIAIVEITNENSLFMWSSEDSLRTLEPYYADILKDRYNEWLKSEYGTDEALKAVWNRGVEPLGKNLLVNSGLESKAAGSVRGWNLERHGEGRMSGSSVTYDDKEVLKLDISSVDEIEWHIQFNQNSLRLEGGKYYTAVLTAAADREKKINCNVTMAHEPWSNLGLSRSVTLSDKLTKYSFGFMCRQDDDNARISMTLGGDVTDVYIQSIELMPGGQTGLKDTESIEKGNIDVYTDNEVRARQVDRLRFYADVEKDYFDGMRNYIKKDLGSKSLITGTIVFGPLGQYAQSDMDFIDGHAYWQHPRFPRKPWDQSDWLINQKPMTDFPDQAVVFGLAGERLEGKPFTVTEYNHPAPLDSQVECVPMIGSFAASQDWDGVWIYTYSHSGNDWDRQHMNSFFDIDTNPAKWGFMVSGALMFRDGGIDPLAEVQYVKTGPEFSGDLYASLHHRYDRGMFRFLADHAKIGWADLLKKQYVHSYTKSGMSRIRSAWGRKNTEMSWKVSDSKGVYWISGDCGWVYTGHGSEISRVSGGKVEIKSPEFIGITMTAMDGKSLSRSREILLTACGRCENIGMKFSQDRSTVGTDWGRGPVQIETVEGTVGLPMGIWKCAALKADGTAGMEVPVANKGSRSELYISGEYKTMWYLLER